MLNTILHRHEQWVYVDEAVKLGLVDLVDHFAGKQINRLPSRKEGNVLFNDALNTFYLWLYGVRHMVKDYSDSERKEGNVLFNDALNTFSLRLYGVGHMVKDHSDSERKEGRKCFI